MSTESVKSSSATLTNLILKGDVMMGSADRDAGFCSGEDDEDVEMHLERTDDEDVRSPTDASEDSVEVKVRVVSPPPSSGRSPRKRKSADPRRVPAKKRHRMLNNESTKPETCPNTTDQSQKQPTSPLSHFRPWSLPSPSVSVKVERTDPTPPPPKQYHPIYGYEPVPQQDEPLSLVKSRPIDRDSIKQESSEVEDVYNRLSPLPLVKKKCTNYELENTNRVPSSKYSNSVKGCTSTIVKNEYLGDNLVKHSTNLYETDIKRLSSPGFVPPVVLFDPRSHDAQSKLYLQPDKSSKHIYYPYDPMRDFLNENSEDFSSVSSFKHKVEEKSDNIHPQTYEIKSKRGNLKHKQNSEQHEMYIEKGQFHGESSGLDKQNTIQRQLQNMDMRYTGEMSDNRESGSDSGQKNSQKEQRNYKNMTRERRIEANARERTRVHTISAAFDTLRKSIPAYSHNQKLSKLSVLRIACSYILTLAKVAGKDYSADKSEPSLAECVDLVSKTIQTEGKLRKRKDD